MTDEQTVLLANFCEELMRDDRFDFLFAQYRDGLVQNLFSTGREAAAEREFIYAKVSGVQEFLGFLNAYIERRDALIRRHDEQSAQPDEAGADQQDIDY